MNVRTLGGTREDALQLIRLRKGIEYEDLDYEAAEAEARKVFSRLAGDPRIAESLAFHAVHICTSDTIGLYDEVDLAEASRIFRDNSKTREDARRDALAFLEQCTREKGSVFSALAVKRVMS